MTDFPIQEFEKNIDTKIRSEGGFGIIAQSGANVGRLNGVRLVNGKALGWQPPDDADPGHIEVNLAARLIHVASSNAVKEVAIERDERLSDIAKAQDKSKLATSAHRELAQVVTDVQRHRDIHAEAKRKMFEAPRLRETDAVGALEDRELRDFVRALSPTDQANLAQKMLEGQADTALIALKRSPTPLPGGVIAGTIDRAWNAYVLRTNPAATAVEAQAGRVQWLEMVLEHSIAALPTPPVREPFGPKRGQPTENT